MKKVFVLLGISTVAASCAREEVEPPMPVEATTPVAYFSFPISNEKGVAVQFENGSKNATRYKWRFGDGTTETGANPAHSYAATGIYTVRLTAFTAQQDSAISTKQVVVKKYDVFAHSSARIAGVYDCTVVRDVSVFFSGTLFSRTTTRLPNEVLTVIKTGPDSLRVNSLLGYYDPNFVFPEVSPVASRERFRVGTAEVAAIDFFPTGDSLRFTTYSHLGISSLTGTTTYYQGRRRP